MSAPRHPARIPLVQRRRAVAVGLAQGLGLAQVPGVVLAEVWGHDPEGRWWRPAGHLRVRVWGGDPARCWAVVREATGDPLREACGLAVHLEVGPPTVWARARAWWRWTLHRIARRYA